MCGSDLERKFSAATKDITEITNADLPPRVNVLIETGGTTQWNNDTIKSSALQRYVHSGTAGTLTKIDEKPTANMSAPETVEDFLTYGKEHYPAEHQAFIFWDHGGGSIPGAIIDEHFPGDSLTLNEMKKAFSTVYPNPEKKKPFDFIGFDACLMSSIETARTFEPYADYLVASEEAEPELGWYYTPWLTELGKNPTIDVPALGQTICDSYAEACSKEGKDQKITLSVTDLNRLKGVSKAYDAWSQDVLNEAAKDPLPFLTEFARRAENTENYGGNTPTTGYYNMADLGDLTKNTEELQPTHAQDVRTALDDCIVYKINSPYRQNATGLSCIYIYAADADYLNSYYGIESANEQFKSLFAYMFRDADTNTPEQPSTTSDTNDSKALPTYHGPSIKALEDTPVTLIDDNTAQINVGKKMAPLVKNVQFTLINVDKKKDLLIVLGIDNKMQADWKNGIFTGSFKAAWPTLNGHGIYMDLTEDTADYTLYDVPINLNGTPYYLDIAYDKKTGIYKILGAKRVITDNKMSSKEMRQLKTSDTITTVFCASRLSDLRTLDFYTGETFTLKEPPHIEESPIDDDGVFAYVFKMLDIKDNAALSQVVFFTLNKGKMTAAHTINN
jgi:hypothetical protein